MLLWKEKVRRKHNIWDNMKNLRKLTGITVFFILIFMLIALFQPVKKLDMGMFQDQFEFYFNDGWAMARIDAGKAPGKPMESHRRIQELFEEAKAQGECQEVSLPYKGNCMAGDTVVFQNMLPKDYLGLALVFTTDDATVRVVLDGKEIYWHGIDGEDDNLGHTPGSHQNVVNIPNMIEEGELWIELTSAYPNHAAVLGETKIETRDMVVIGVVGNSIADIGCCILIVIMSMIMFVLALIRQYTSQPQRGELFLGLAGITAGIYCFIGTDTLSIFYNVQEAYTMQEYLVLLLPAFLALYFEKNLHPVYPRRFSVLLCCVCINAAVQILLQKLGIRDLEDMINISAAMLGLVCVAAIVSLVHYDYRHRQYQAVVWVVSMLILLLGGIANVIMNLVTGTLHVNMAGQYSMTVFAIMMAIMHTFQLSKEYRANAEERVKVAERQNVQLAQAKKDADAAKQEAQAANEAKGKFLAHMSHEIRTPINAVLGMDEMILRESKEQNIKEYAMDIYMAGQTLLSLINDILDFSKIESGKMEIVPVEYDMSSLIHDLVNMAMQRAEGKNLELVAEVSHELPSRLYGDDVRIRQVLVNILTNAVKYTHEGTVWLRVQSRCKDRTAMLRFEVEDTGIGIRQEDLPKLSAEFERIEEDRNRNIEGTGLGMSITIQLLELLGSRLHVESVYGEGSKFYFELEQEIVDLTPIGDFESRVRQLAGNYNYNTRFCAPDAKILVTDDNAVNRKVLRSLLKETQIQVTDAEGGEECLKLVQQEHFDLIFLDHMMPGMDGIETLHCMKGLADYPCKNTPVVVLTANAVSGAKEKYISEGFDDFLPKPVVPEKLEKLIQKMLPSSLLKEAGASGQGVQQAGEAMPDDFLDTLPQVDGLDWQYAWMHLPDMHLLEYTVKEFYSQIDAAAGSLEQAFGQITASGQLGQYRIQVHAMKSLAATVGIMPLSGVAKILETAAKDGKIDAVLSITPAFLDEWRSYRQKLQGVFGLGAQEKKDVEDVSVIKALVEMVRISMQEMDIDKADEVMGQLLEYKYPGSIGGMVEKLAQAVSSLDAGQAGLLASSIIEGIGQ